MIRKRKRFNLQKVIHVAFFKCRRGSGIFKIIFNMFCNIFCKIICKIICTITWNMNLKEIVKNVHFSSSKGSKVLKSLSAKEMWIIYTTEILIIYVYYYSLSILNIKKFKNVFFFVGIISWYLKMDE